VASGYLIYIKGSLASIDRLHFQCCILTITIQVFFLVRLQSGFHLVCNNIMI
jgi:hypothetical protein